MTTGEKRRSEYLRKFGTETPDIGDVCRECDEDWGQHSSYHCRPGVVKLVTEVLDAKPTNPKDASATTRLDLSLFPATARAYGALALTEGDLKYGGYNWRDAGVLASIYYAAAGRHLDKWFNGEECDPKTKVPHLANALACIALLIDAVEMKNLNDDRPPPADVGELLTRFEGNVGHLQQIFPRKAKRYRAKK